jgi:hypothetical protein
LGIVARIGSGFLSRKSNALLLIICMRALKKGAGSQPERICLEA